MRLARPRGEPSSEFRLAWCAHGCAVLCGAIRHAHATALTAACCGCHPWPVQWLLSILPSFSPSQNARDNCCVSAQCFFFVEPSVSFLSDRCKAFSSALAFLSLSPTTTVLTWHTVVTASPNAAMRDQSMTYIRSMANATEQPTSRARCKSRSLLMTIAAILASLFLGREWSVCVSQERGRLASSRVGEIAADALRTMNLFGATCQPHGRRAPLTGPSLRAGRVFFYPVGAATSTSTVLISHLDTWRCARGTCS